ncbi:MAG: hypothetical protein OXC40_00645 [Proteobacteria bacterium]|nr:hypothetical protein [Pseudomonadota bacterium]
MTYRQSPPYLGDQKNLSQVMIVGGGIAGLSLAYHFIAKKTPFRLYCDPQDALSASTIAQGVATLKGYHLARDQTFLAKMQGHRELLKIMKNIQFNDVALQVSELFPSKVSYNQQVERTYHRNFRGFCDVTTREISDQSRGNDLYPVVHDYPHDYVFLPAKLMSCLFMYIKNSSFSYVCRERFKPSDFLNMINSGVQSHVILALGCHTKSWLKALGFISTGSDFFSPGIVAGGELGQEVVDPWLSYINAGVDHQSKSLWGFKQGSKSLRLMRVNGPGGPPYFHVSWGSYDSAKTDKIDCPVAKQGVTEGLRQLGSSFGLPLPSALLEQSGRVLSGVRYQGRKQRPIIGKLTLDQRLDPQQKMSLWVFAGFYKSGYSLAPWLSKAVVSQIVGDQWDQTVSESWIRADQQFQWVGNRV